MAENISSISDENFEEEVLKTELLVLVDFWAVWCAPCYAIVPSLENLIPKYKDKVKIVKLNVDENMKTPSKFGITSIPALLLFKDGELKETLVGVHSQDKIEEAIGKHL